MNALLRIYALVLKELRVTFADPKSRRIVFVPVLLQMLLFPFAATLEVKNSTLAILNEDNDQAAWELQQRFSHTAAFPHIRPIRTEHELVETLDTQKALVVVRFPADFSRKIAAAQPAPLQLLLDGRRSNSAQIAAGYLGEIITGYGQEKAAAAPQPPIIRHRYNPNLNYTWFILPSLVAVILSIGSLITTTLSVAREREEGTLDQLRVSPLTLEMLLLGKTIPSLLIGLAQGTLILLCAVFCYRVPFEGSLLLFYAAAVLYFLSLVGFGLLISAISSTQQQAFLGTFAFLMPCVLLSGFAAPIENMPHWLQTLTWLNPLRHFMLISRSIFLKDVHLPFILAHALPLALIATLTLTATLLIFRRKFGG